MADDVDEPRFKPPHPGEFLREDILPALGMSITDLAKHLKVSRPSLSELVNERRSVSTEMAVKLGIAFRNGARFWLALQMHYDLWEAGDSKSLSIEPLNWDGQEAA